MKKFEEANIKLIAIQSSDSVLTASGGQTWNPDSGLYEGGQDYFD